MESIRISQHIGQDGILHLDIPVGLIEQDVEVMVIYQPVQSLVASGRSLADLYGICADDPITLDEQGISDALDDELAMRQSGVECAEMVLRVSGFLRGF